jgi:hypothetical protein
VVVVSQLSQSLLARFDPLKTKIKEQEVDISETIGGHLVPIDILKHDKYPKRVLFASIRANERMDVVAYVRIVRFHALCIAW